jgi:hypothetical protein
MNTPGFRPDIRANAGLDYIGAQRGKGVCKPQTALDMVLAIKRIHKRLGVPIGVLPLVRSTFQGFARQ